MSFDKNHRDKKSCQSKTGRKSSLNWSFVCTMAPKVEQRDKNGAKNRRRYMGAESAPKESLDNNE